MALTIHAELVAASRADDLALRSLADIVELTADCEARVIGGHMASIWLAAMPVSGIIDRRTTDADSAVTTQLASTGDLHERLLQQGYCDTSGNNYRRTVPGVGDLSIDLLVPSTDGRFRKHVLGGRAFDASPGLGTVLAAPPVTAFVGATLLDGSVLEITARIPSLEFAVVLKAYAWSLRHAEKDVSDLQTLLEIAVAYPESAIGGWRLNEAPLAGSRADAARILALLARDLRRQRRADVESGRLSALIASLVTAKPR